MNTIRHDLGRFALVPEWIVTTVSPLAQKAWTALWIYTGNGTHDAWPSHDRLAGDLGVSTRTVRRILEELEQVGALSIQARSGTSNLYTLHWKPVDTHVHPTLDTHVLPPRTPMSYEERQSEIDKQSRGKQDTRVHRRTPGDAPLTREQIRTIRQQAADAIRLTPRDPSEPNR